jgi:hypothetical protein
MISWARSKNAQTPEACEYARLAAGGIVWDSDAIPVPIKIETDVPNFDFDEAIPEIPWSRAALTESWFHILYGYRDGHWKPFFPDVPREPRLPSKRRHGIESMN